MVTQLIHVGRRWLSPPLALLLLTRSPWGTQPLALFLEEAATVEVLPTPKGVENNAAYVPRWRQVVVKLGTGQGKV